MCIWGCNSNEISLAQTTLAIPIVYMRFACWEVTWPNYPQTRCCQYTGIPLDILEDHWSHKYSGMPLEPHWLMLAPVVSQWQSSVNLHNWNIEKPLEDHWNTVGSTLETQWLRTVLSPVAYQCTLGSTFQAQWIATGLPLNYRWLRVRVTQVCS